MINHIDGSGSFSGTYSSGVDDSKGEHSFQGQFNNEGCTLGWTVVYKDAQSTSSWSGQIQTHSKTKKPHILTTWLLTKKTDPSLDWYSTHVGVDTFTQDKPTEDVIHRAKLRYGPSHLQDD